MDSKLNSDEMTALQSLDPDESAGAAIYREGDLPQRLFAFNLVPRQPSGTTVLTRHGERTLFRQACLSALLSLERGGGADMPGGVSKWLMSSGFIKSVGTAALPPSITPRGKLWLASFEADEAVAENAMTAIDFERRRA